MIDHTYDASVAAQYITPEGCYVQSVDSSSVAVKAGIKQNDVIVKADGKIVNVLMILKA